MTGDRISHPLLISLANLRMDFRAKSSNHAFVLLALLPIPKYLHPDKKARGVLENRLIHSSLDFILRPLKQAATFGIMMSDPWGGTRYSFPALAGYIADYQEAIVLAGVCGKTSPVTMAGYKQLGDSFRHKPRTASITLAQLASISSKVDPNEDIVEYMREAKKYRLNGVDQPFWRDWPLADPHSFFTPEPLHHWFKMFWDHEAKWCIHVLGDAEIDFRFCVLHPYVSFRHFKEGISKLKQVTGREHRDVQRYLLPVIAGAAPKDFIVAVRALIEFRYLAQAPVIDDITCDKIQAALALFHANKSSIAGARVGSRNQPINNWYIPKLELMQSVVPNIRLNGVPMQWSADITEHAHITEIKDPAKAGNNQNYESQITRNLDRADKCSRFDLATSVCEAGVGFGYRSAAERILDDNDDDGLADDDLEINTTSNLLDKITPVSRIAGPIRRLNNYFDEAQRLLDGGAPTAPTPYRTFAIGSTAFHLTRDPNVARIPIDDAAKNYFLDDLRPALADHAQRVLGNAPTPHNMRGRRTAGAAFELPFQELRIWHAVRLQSKAYHNPDKVLPAQTVNGIPRSADSEHGRRDTVLVNVDASKTWPESGLTGESSTLNISWMTI